MDMIMILALVVPVTLLLVGVVIGFLSTRSNYFKFDDEHAKFFVKKHSLFRMFGILYNGIHYLLSIFAVIFTMITVYMVMDKSIGVQKQIFFLLLAAISSTLSSTLKLQDAAKGYFKAMRVLETAILTYKEKHIIDDLIKANEKAEEIIGEKFA